MNPEQNQPVDMTDLRDLIAEAEDALRASKEAVLRLETILFRTRLLVEESRAGQIEKAKLIRNSTV
jgi:hypothetical protein